MTVLKGLLASSFKTKSDIKIDTIYHFRIISIFAKNVEITPYQTEMDWSKYYNDFHASILDTYIVRFNNVIVRTFTFN